MPQIPKETIQKTCIYLKKIKVFTIDQLASSLNCSIPSARLKLKQWNSYTSYNRNGRFYQVPSNFVVAETSLFTGIDRIMRVFKIAYIIPQNVA